MNFQTFKSSLEAKLSNKFKFELLEFSYLPYCFGSGELAIKVNGICLLFSFDGKDGILEIKKSKKHEKYPNCTWQTIKSYNDLNLFDSSIIETLI